MAAAERAGQSGARHGARGGSGTSHERRVAAHGRPARRAAGAPRCGTAARRSAGERAAPACRAAVGARRGAPAAVRAVAGRARPRRRHGGCSGARCGSRAGRSRGARPAGRGTARRSRTVAGRARGAATCCPRARRGWRAARTSTARGRSGPGALRRCGAVTPGLRDRRGQSGARARARCQARCRRVWARSTCSSVATRASSSICPVVEREALLASTVPAVTADGIGWDPDRGELWFAGETAEAVLLELDSRRRELRDEVEALRVRAAGAADEVVEARARADAAAAAFAPVAHLRNVRRARTGVARAAGRRRGEARRDSCAWPPRPPRGSRRRSPSGPDAWPRICAGSRRARSSSAPGGCRYRRSRAGRGTTGRSDAARRRPVRPSSSGPAPSRSPLSPARRASASEAAAERAGGRRARTRRARPGPQQAAGRARVDAAGRGCDAARAVARPSKSRDSRRRCASAPKARRPARPSSARTLRRLGADEVELRQQASQAGERLAAIDVELARTDAERDEAQRRLDGGGRRAGRRRRSRRARGEARALRAAARAARPGQPARQGGVRGREGAAARSCPCSAPTSSRASPSWRSCATT